MKLRFRHMYMGVGSLLVIALFLLTDPDSGLIQALPFGAGTVANILILVKSVLYVGLLHLSRKAMMDYIDLEEIFKKAMGSSRGAGLFSIAVALMCISIAIVIYAATH